MKNDRDSLLVCISIDNYDSFKDSELYDEIGGMLGYPDFISCIVDDLMNGEEYKKAIEEYGDKRWHYFNNVHKTSLDWYYMDIAREIIRQKLT